MDFGEKEVKFSRKEVSVAIDAFREAINDRLRKGNDPLWHLDILRAFSNMQTRRGRKMDVSEGNVLGSPRFVGIIGVISQYADNTQEAIIQLTNTHPKNEVNIPLQRKYNGMVAESMVLEFKIASTTPTPVPAPEANRLVGELSAALRTATADDFRAQS